MPSGFAPATRLSDCRLVRPDADPIPRSGHSYPQSVEALCHSIPTPAQKFSIIQMLLFTLHPSNAKYRPSGEGIP